ncbi:unknown [Bacteroides sp. CAG:1076]|nr:unknown [Bacteroides sp. CAG:1076]
MIFLEPLNDSRVHFAELAAVTFIEYQYHMLAVNLVRAVL